MKEDEERDISNASRGREERKGTLQVEGRVIFVAVVEFLLHDPPIFRQPEASYRARSSMAVKDRLENQTCKRKEET